MALGTIILTDKWKGYNPLSSHGYTHLTVNHRRGFVDPQTGVHTNTCEGMWFHAKRQMLRGYGRARTDSAALETALCEFMWRKKQNLTSSDSSVRRCFNDEIPRLMCQACARRASGVQKGSSTLYVRQVCARRAPGVHQACVCQVCVRSPVCARCAPDVRQACIGVCARRAPGVLRHITNLPWKQL